MDRTRERQVEKQRRVQERIQRHLARTARSQRRPGRLRREDVVAAALDLLSETGIDGMTLRDVAARLSIQAPALYWHFANKRDMVDAMAEALLADFVGALELPDDPGEWRALAAADWPRTARVHARPSGWRANRCRQRRRWEPRAHRSRGQGAAFTAGRRLRPGDGLGRRQDGDQLHARRGHGGAGVALKEPAARSRAKRRMRRRIGRSIDAELRLSPAAQFDLGLELVLRGLEGRR